MCFFWLGEGRGTDLDCNTVWSELIWFLWKHWVQTAYCHRCWKGLFDTKFQTQRFHSVVWKLFFFFFFPSKRGFTSWLLALNWPMNQHVAADSTPALVEGNMTDLISSKICCFCSASKAQKSTLSVNSLFENGDSRCIYYTPLGEREAEFDRCYRNL